MEEPRISVILPTITCSTCGASIEISKMGEHVCSAPPVPDLNISTDRRGDRDTSATKSKSKLNLDAGERGLFFRPGQLSSGNPSQDDRSAAQSVASQQDRRGYGGFANSDATMSSIDRPNPPSATATKPSFMERFNTAEQNGAMLRKESYELDRYRAIGIGSGGSLRRPGTSGSQDARSSGTSSSSGLSGGSTSLRRKNGYGGFGPPGDSGSDTSPDRQRDTDRKFGATDRTVSAENPYRHRPTDSTISGLSLYSESSASINGGARSNQSFMSSMASPALSSIDSSFAPPQQLPLLLAPMSTSRQQPKQHQQQPQQKQQKVLQAGADLFESLMNDLKTSIDDIEPLDMSSSPAPPMLAARRDSSRRRVGSLENDVSYDVSSRKDSVRRGDRGGDDAYEHNEPKPTSVLDNNSNNSNNRNNAHPPAEQRQAAGAARFRFSDDNQSASSSRADLHSRGSDDSDTAQLRRRVPSPGMERADPAIQNGRTRRDERDQLDRTRRDNDRDYEGVWLQHSKSNAADPRQPIMEQQAYGSKSSRDNDRSNRRRERAESSGSTGKPRGYCRACNEAIRGKSISSADGRLSGKYHKACFVCTTCKEPFSGTTFYVYGDKPYCERHYHRVNGSLCGKCRRGIEGRCFEDEDDIKYHLNCFRCHVCGDQLRDGYIPVDGRFYCERDALRLFSPPRSDRTVEHKPSSRNQMGQQYTRDRGRDDNDNFHDERQYNLQQYQRQKEQDSRSQMHDQYQPPQPYGHYYAGSSNGSSGRGERVELARTALPLGQPVRPPPRVTSPPSAPPPQQTPEERLEMKRTAGLGGLSAGPKIGLAGIGLPAQFLGADGTPRLNKRVTRMGMI